MYRLADVIGMEDEPSLVDGISTTGLPIKSPVSLNWKYKTDPRRLVRMFEFSYEEKYNAFILDVLEHQAETGHHGRLTCQYPKVKIEVWTHSLNDVTEIDSEWAQTVNEIYEGYNG